ncbi:hypothetical protein PWP89_08150 [Stenotrophomonas rhizophila]|uniref:hypothetical protein n=1 Tax=Stenotrophomonas rhizophila TaxID=216778 RepID=UPI00117BF78D|nr:hypothetical protein [Stenotrophomonas rhizophila]
MSRPFPMLSTEDPADAPVLVAALVSFDQAVQALIEQDPDRHGRFSRAYVTAIFHACLLPHEPGAGVPRGRPDPEIAQALKRWIQDQLLRHPGEGDDHRLTAARRAAHGFWLQSMACPIDDDGQPRAARLLEGLLALTRPA